MKSVPRSHLFSFLMVALLFVFHVAQAADKVPNFVIILADDLGYGDLGCYGHPTIRTPNLDRMAAEGMRFTDFYVAACVCTPSRSALLTGRLPIRNGMAGSEQRRVIYAADTGGLPQEEITIAQALKTKGYATACVGKWHLAGETSDAIPTRRGFGQYFGLRWSNDMEPAGKVPKPGSMSLKPDPKWWSLTLMRNEKVFEKDADPHTLTRRYTDEATAFIRANKKKPFFLYFPHTYPHVPLFASDKFSGKSARGLFGDVVEELDASVGEVLETLRKEKLADNTLVFFTSDNGPWLVKELAGGSAGPLREGKGSTWEGGMREPGIAWWPGKIKPGVVTHELASTMDLFNTIMKLTDIPMPKDRVMDGFDMSPILFENGKSRRDTMFYYRGGELFAVRKGAYKAHFQTAPGYAGNRIQEKFEKHETPLLFNLANDPGERFNIAAEHPEVVEEIQKAVAEHKANLVPGKPQY
jgi:arylsulfatase A-like enzyme